MPMKRAHSPWYDVVVAVISLLVALVALVALAISFIVPVTLDKDAQQRERTRSCIDAVVDMRKSAQQIRGGYAVDKGARGERLADWDEGVAAGERMRVTCRNSSLPAPSGTSADTLWEQMHTAREQAAAGQTDLRPIDVMMKWTTDCITHLTTPQSS
ncbi:hypothetical protein [Lentzea cavernae]|uniref:Uncharacterized protein n=1 Tax=Lentzea cavernae TaxID=2020703 RepID=A0ABQ3M622_9PSEU|nr:hypothetical protein [Lentzea cavernae]GHH32587.1 hypothetical protein GCM10017774_13720 [Lentzea cavernae]